MKKDHTHLKRFVKAKVDNAFWFGYAIGALVGLIGYIIIFLQK